MVLCTNCKNCKGKDNVYDTDVDEVFTMYYCEKIGWMFEEEALWDTVCEDYVADLDDDD